MKKNAGAPTPDPSPLIRAMARALRESLQLPSPERALVTQMHRLDTIYHEMLCLSLGRVDAAMDGANAALRAQQQCLRTIEALSALKRHEEGEE